MAIPDSAVFHSGYYDRAPRDNGIYLSFSVPSEAVESLFADGWSESAAPVGDAAAKELLAAPVARQYVYDGEMYTYLICAAAEDGAVNCVFHGRYPTEV